MKVFAILALCIVAASAGVVVHEPCGGDGQVVQIRISDCEGEVAEMTPGVEYHCEGDVIPAAASAALHLHVSARFQGADVTIIDADIPDSAVQPDMQYTLRWSVTPGAIPVGNTIAITSAVSDVATTVVQMCGRIMARIV